LQVKNQKYFNFIPAVQIPVDFLFDAGGSIRYKSRIQRKDRMSKNVFPMPHLRRIQDDLLAAGPTWWPIPNRPWTLQSKPNVLIRDSDGRAKAFRSAVEALGWKDRQLGKLGFKPAEST
jgi:hypothetical protein